MPVLHCLVTETVSAEGGEKLLPKLGRQADAKKYDRKKYAGGSKLASYSVDKTNKDCSKLGHTKPLKGFEQGKQLNGPRVEQQNLKTGSTAGTGSFVKQFSNRWSNPKTGSRVEKIKQSLRRNVESMRRRSKSKTEYAWNLQQAREKLQSAIITAGLKSRIEVVIDGFCGTASSCALYHLKRSPRTVVVGIDRDQTSAFVHSFIPTKYHHRFLFLNTPVKDPHPPVEFLQKTHRLYCILSHAHRCDFFVAQGRFAKFGIGFKNLNHKASSLKRLSESQIVELHPLGKMPGQQQPCALVVQTSWLLVQASTPVLKVCADFFAIVWSNFPFCIVSGNDGWHVAMQAPLRWPRSSEAPSLAFEGMKPPLISFPVGFREHISYNSV